MVLSPFLLESLMPTILSITNKKTGSVFPGGVLGPIGEAQAIKNPEVFEIAYQKDEALSEELPTVYDKAQLKKLSMKALRDIYAMKSKDVSEPPSITTSIDGAIAAILQLQKG